MMKAPEDVALLIDAIIFLQNNVSLGMLLHHPEDILVRNLYKASSRVFSRLENR